MAIRLQRVALIGWAVGIGLLGFFVGMIADEVDALAENDAVATMLEQAGAGSLTDSYLAITMLMCALTAAGFTISSVLRLRSEEVAFRASPVLATPVSRTRWMMSHTIVAVVGSIAVMLVAGLLTGGGYALQTGDAGEILPVVAAGLIQVPPMLVLGGIAAALFGFLPRWSYVAWAPLAVAAVVGVLAETLDLPSWVRNLSPFEHVPALPAASFELAPPLVLTAIAVAATIVGLVGFKRRAVA
jgi:ABC-2 type transport system permease protein